MRAVVTTTVRHDNSETRCLKFTHPHHHNPPTIALLFSPQNLATNLQSPLLDAHTSHLAACPPLQVGVEGVPSSPSLENFCGQGVVAAVAGCFHQQCSQLPLLWQRPRMSLHLHLLPLPLPCLLPCLLLHLLRRLLLHVVAVGVVGCRRWTEVLSRHQHPRSPQRQRVEGEEAGVQQSRRRHPLSTPRSPRRRRWLWRMAVLVASSAVS